MDSNWEIITKNEQNYTEFNWVRTVGGRESSPEIIANLSFGKFIDGFGFIMHSGAGPADPKGEGALRAMTRLHEIGDELSKKMQNTFSSVASTKADSIKATCKSFCTDAICRLEDEPLFNAGLGSAVQGDGSIRMTAAFMDSFDLKFSACINAEFIRNPIKLALILQGFKSSVLAGSGIPLVCQRYGLEMRLPYTEKRTQNWLNQMITAEDDRAGSELKELLNSDTMSKEKGSLQCGDTVGCIVYVNPYLVAGASTGGRGGEIPGRVSDSGTVAGTYVSPHAAICATGVGEHIVDDGVAVKLETLVSQGVPLEQAAKVVLEAALQKSHQYGFIGVDNSGKWVSARTTRYMGVYCNI